MARPVPHALFLTELAVWVQKNLSARVQAPTLLAADPAANYALVAGYDDPDIQLLDRRRGVLVRRLPLPPRSRKGTDFTKFAFSDDGLCVAAYNGLDSSFAIWSLSAGTLIHHSEGVGQIPPAMCFMPGGRVALCDGPRIHIYNLGGQILFTTPVSDDLRSLILYAPPNPQPTLIAVGVFRKGLGGHTLHTFKIEEGKITSRQDGPQRHKPSSAHDNKSIMLHELTNIPGSTERILIVTEEEHVERRAPTAEWEYDAEYSTRLLAVEPRRGNFYPSEVSLPGRHCLQQSEGELLLIDERGRRRRVAGFPLRLEKIDWRLSD